MIARADRVARLLADPELAGAFQAVRSAIHDRIEQCPVRDTEGLIQLRLMLKLLQDVRANLELALQDGKLEQFRIDEQRRFSIVKR